MPLKIVRSPEPTPEELTKSLFLVGARTFAASDPPWQLKMIEFLRQAGFDGTVFLPFPDDELSIANDADRIEWQCKHLALADVIAAWCPYDSTSPHEITTGIQLGEWLRSGKLLYGRPAEPPNVRYLDVLYSEINQGLDPPFNAPCESLEQLAQQCVERLGDGAERRGGERSVPLFVWRSPQFQVWYQDLVAAGNRLETADLLWTFRIPQASNVVFCFSLRAKVWVTAEKRYKDNEFIVSRPDISSVCAYFPDPQSHEFLDTKILLNREFRLPGRTPDGFLRDLPSGSSFCPDQGALAVAVNELKEEIGIEIESDRFRYVTDRQLAGTFGTHKAYLFAVELTGDEVQHLEALEQSGASAGIVGETEQTYVEVRTIRQILNQKLLDHACIGMIFQACFAHCASPVQVRLI